MEKKIPEGVEPERLRLQEDGEFVKKIGDPMLPTEQEIKELNEMGHAVYRSWCDVSVRARSKEWDCRKDDGKERKLPEYAWDHCFPGDELGLRWTVIVGKERKTGLTMAKTVSPKEGRGMFAVAKCLECVDINGDANREI
eukprot:12402159-Karenia_brevis.AAC.1